MCMKRREISKRRNKRNENAWIEETNELEHGLSEIKLHFFRIMPNNRHQTKER